MDVLPRLECFRLKRKETHAEISSEIYEQRGNKKITGTKAALRLTFRKKKFMKIRNEEKRLGQFNTDRAY